MKSSKLTVAIPTWNNFQQLVDTLQSLVCNTDFDGRILVINNGTDRYEDVQAVVPRDIGWIDAGENLGWMGGINLALKHTETELFCMCNDDVYFPPSRPDFWERLLDWFILPTTGGVGPISNYVSGWQNMRQLLSNRQDPRTKGVMAITSPLLIGFCAVYRTELLADGLDESLPGGDDYDLSIRVTDAGYDLIVDRRCFLFHIGAQTGTRVHKDYWDSFQHQALTTNAIARKHGLARWYQLVSSRFGNVAVRPEAIARMKDVETLFQSQRLVPSDINEHLDLIADLASQCSHVTEFGTNDGTSTAALLRGAPRVITYDIVRSPHVDAMRRITNGNFSFRQDSTLTAEIEKTDLLLIDDLHTYPQVKAELEKHAKHVRRWILFHDTELFGYSGEEGDTVGIRRAIDEFVVTHPEWSVRFDLKNCNGLMGLERHA